MNVLAVDIGGTSMKTGIFKDGVLAGLKEYEHRGRQGVSYLMEDLFAVIHDMEKEASFISIGLSISGQIDARSGMVVFATESIPGFTGTPIRQIVQDQTGLPVFIENDVNCAALGESVFGSGKDFSDFLCITYGTGIGGAIIMDRKLWTGRDGIAGELGHMVLHYNGEPCVCGRRGCYEHYASTTALIRAVKKQTGLTLNGREIFQRKDEPVIAREIDLWTDEIAEGLISLLHIFNPSAIVLGGGIMSQECVFESVRRKVKERVIPSFGKTVLCQASLGNSAGVHGAYLLTQN